MDETVAYDLRVEQSDGRSWSTLLSGVPALLAQLAEVYRDDPAAEVEVLVVPGESNDPKEVG